jgi:hypothetical protein
MSKALKRMSFEKFSANLDRIFERIVVEGESIVIEKGEGKLVEVKPVAPPKSDRKAVAKEDDEAFLSAAGGWADVDIDTFLKDIYSSRESSRPPVEL